MRVTALRLQGSVVNAPSLRGYLPVYAAAAEGDALLKHGAVQLGVGKVAAAVSLCQRLAKARPAGVLLFGVAGAYPARHRSNSKLQVGEVVVVERDGFGDEGVGVADGFLSMSALSLGPRDRVAMGPFGLDALASRTAVRVLEVEVVSATTVSTCSGSEALSAALAMRTEAAIETMEGAAVAYVCEMLSVPLLHVRAISNYCGERSRGEWDLRRACAAVQDAVLRLLG